MIYGIEEGGCMVGMFMGAKLARRAQILISGVWVKIYLNQG